MLVTGSAQAQRKPRVPPPDGGPKPAPVELPAAPDTARSRVALTVRAGFGFPLSHASLKEFWTGGFAAGIAFAVEVRRGLALGAAIDLQELPFSEQAFTDAYPGVEPKALDLGCGAVTVTLRSELDPGADFTPYLSAGLGVHLSSKAEYSTTVGGVRVVYYRIPGAARLTAAAGLGGALRIGGGLALDASADLRYVHHDPESGLLTSLRAGLTFFL
jgi:opacity protein-like surface antigen